MRPSLIRQMGGAATAFMLVIGVACAANAESVMKVSSTPLGWGGGRSARDH